MNMENSMTCRRLRVPDKAEQVDENLFSDGAKLTNKKEL
jgi:hypothetical protein